MKSELINSLKQVKRGSVPLKMKDGSKVQLGRPKKSDIKDPKTLTKEELAQIEAKKEKVNSQRITAQQIATGGGRAIRLIDYRNIIIAQLGEVNFNKLCGITANYLDCRCCENVFPVNYYHTQVGAANRMFLGPYCKDCRKAIQSYARQGVPTNTAILALREEATKQTGLTFKQPEEVTDQGIDSDLSLDTEEEV